MYLQVFAFILAVSGWMLVTSTLAIEYWKVYTLDGVVLATTTYMSNLWKMCVADLTGVSDCKDFPSMLALDDTLHACRALIISSVCLTFFGNGLALMGMECTKLVGKRKPKVVLVWVAGVTYALSGLCSLTACSLYAHQVTSEFFDPNFMAQKYDFGAALFIGWSGSFLCIAAGIILCSSLACLSKEPCVRRSARSWAPQPGPP
ncbi:claudin-10-like [Synchiropus splendidus]|uniref:claudin-10-like n=1 Tax=Synchiropus splendidus TaxID=270530 RepID=UPI00237E3D6C|nr:claudin-10-like [Synchiropus splendidus]